MRSIKIGYDLSVAASSYDKEPVFICRSFTCLNPRAFFFPMRDMSKGAI